MGPTCPSTTLVVSPSASLSVATNAPGSVYLDNANCVLNIASQCPTTVVTFTAFNTEANYDFFRVSTPSGVSSWSGPQTRLPTQTVTGSALTLTFTSDSSVTLSGVQLTVACSPAAGSPVCPACSPGAYCPGGAAALCPAGTYNAVPRSTSASACFVCPSGAFCPLGASAPTLCPVGTANANTGSQSSAACVTCAVGTGSAPGFSACSAPFAVTRVSGSSTPGYANGAGVDSRFASPSYGICFDGAQTLYLADATNNAVRAVTVTAGSSYGATITVAGGSPGTSGYVDAVGAAARFNGPTDVTTDGAGRVWVADRSNNVSEHVGEA